MGSVWLTVTNTRMNVFTLSLITCLLPVVFMLSMALRQQAPARRLGEIETTTASTLDNNREAAAYGSAGKRKVSWITVKRRVRKMSAVNNPRNIVDKIGNKKNADKKRKGSVKRASKLEKKHSQESRIRLSNKSKKKYRIKLKPRTKHQKNKLDALTPTANALPNNTADTIPDTRSVNAETIADTAHTSETKTIPGKTPALYLTERGIFSPANAGGRRHMELCEGEKDSTNKERNLKFLKSFLKSYTQNTGINY